MAVGSRRALGEEDALETQEGVRQREAADSPSDLEVELTQLVVRCVLRQALDALGKLGEPLGLRLNGDARVEQVVGQLAPALEDRGDGIGRLQWLGYSFVLGRPLAHGRLVRRLPQRDVRLWIAGRIHLHLVEMEVHPIV